MSQLNYGDVYTLNPHLPKQRETLLEAVRVAVYHTLDTRLYDELGALDTRRCGNIERRAIAVIGALGNLSYSIGLGVEYIWLGLTHIVLADILKACRSTVIAIRDNHIILDYKRTDLTAHAV